MDNKRAIPKQYMTVGELAKKMETTVRTLQYYDKEGVLSPSAISGGGRRLYDHKDMVRLHQILSLKSLGFSLDDIRDRLISLDTPADVAEMLTQQAAAVREKLQNLSQSLKAIEMLKEEVLQMQSVDFKKYADIIVNLQMKNEYYWLIKHFDEQTLDTVRSRFDKESGTLFMNKFKGINEKALELQEEGILPEDEKAQELAEEFWNMITEFTDGDMGMLPKLMELGTLGEEEKEGQKQAAVTAYLEPALDIYISRQGINPFGEELS